MVDSVDGTAGSMRRTVRALCSAAQPGWQAPWRSLRVPSHMLTRLKVARVEAPPSPVQQAVLRGLMPRLPGEEPTSRNAVIRWHTGSGKTLAYALPLLSRIDHDEPGVQAIIVTPTRELCLQTLHVLLKLTKQGKANKKGNSTTVKSYMGEPTQMMLSEIKHHPPHIVVGTPQTLGALLDSGALPLVRDERLRTLVIDEVDAFSAPFRWVSLAKILTCGSHAHGLARKSQGRRTRSFAPGELEEPEALPPPPPPSPSAPTGERRRTVWTRGGVWLVSAMVPEHVVQHCLHSAGHSPEERRVFEPRGKPWSSRRSGQTPAAVRHVMVPPPRPALIPLLRRLTAPGNDPAEEAEAGAAGEAEIAARRGGAALVFVQNKYTSDALLNALRRERPPEAPTAAEAPEHHVAGEGGEFRSLTREEQQHIMKWRLRADGVHSESNRHDPPEMGGRQRGSALRRMAEGELNVLTATDMLSRGVDIKGASYVVNANMPEDSGAYLHRAGRVGRLSGKSGVVISLPSTAKEAERLRGYAAELGFDLHEARL